MKEPTWIRKSQSSTPERINVYLGAKLVERVRRLRQQGIDINISGVCQRAVERACDHAERLREVRS